MSQNGVMEALLCCLDHEHAHAIIEHRRFTIRKPLTVYAAKLLAKRFAEWGDGNEAADMMIERSWQGFDASWVRDRPRPALTGNGMIDALMRH